MLKRPTIRDIALKAGCHYSTVSLALRNNAKIPLKTRILIQGIAREMNYRPDPMLSALTAYRRDTKPKVGVTALAWVTNHSTRGGWKKWYITHQYYEGAKREAESRGYRLDEFWLQEKGMTSRRLNQILETRNIQGILLPPQEKPTSIELNWEKFSAVTFGYSLIKPQLHTVTNHEYRNMRHLMKELYSRGYKRPGLVGRKHSAERVEYNWLAAFLLEQLETEEEDRISPLILDSWDSDTFIEWYEKTKPDVIVTRSMAVARMLKKHGIKTPDDVGLAFNAIHEPGTNVSGIQKNAFRIGVLAADMMVDMIQRNDKGIPRFPQRHLLEGYWVEGETIRKRLPGKTAAYVNSGDHMHLNFPAQSRFLKL